MDGTLRVNSQLVCSSCFGQGCYVIIYNTVYELNRRKRIKIVVYRLSNSGHKPDKPLKLNFNRYISFSVFFHLLFIAVLSSTHLSTHTPAPLFDVTIVGPLETIIPPVLKEKKPAIKKRARELIKPHRPRPPEKTEKPETLLGEDTETIAKDTGTITEDAETVPESAEIITEGSGKPDIADLLTAKEERPVERKSIEKPITGPPAKSAKYNSAGEEKDHTDRAADVRGQIKKEKTGPSLVPPEMLFDRKTIEKFALKKSPAQKGLAFDTAEFRHRGYMRMLKERIERTWKYPTEAARRGISGDLYIKFTILKNGKLGELELLRTSGYRDLDMAAIKALKKAEPFWPLPDDWEKDDLEIKGHFIYIYGTAYVM